MRSTGHPRHTSGRVTTDTARRSHWDLSIDIRDCPSPRQRGSSPRWRGSPRQRDRFARQRGTLATEGQDRASVTFARWRGPGLAGEDPSLARAGPRRQGSPTPAWKRARQRGSLAGASIPSLAWVPTLARPPTSPAWDPRWRASTLVSVSTHIFLQKSEIHLMFLIQYLQKVFENSDFWEISMLKRSNTTWPYYFEKK